MMIIIISESIFEKCEIDQNETELFIFYRLLVVKSISFSVIIKCRIFNALNPVQWPSLLREWNIYIVVSRQFQSTMNIYSDIHFTTYFLACVQNAKYRQSNTESYILCHTLTHTVRTTWFSIAQTQFPMGFAVPFIWCFHRCVWVIRIYYVRFLRNLCKLNCYFKDFGYCENA